jgi:hypothetical protein
VLKLSEILFRPVRSIEEQRFQQLMQEYHYLGALLKMVFVKMVISDAQALLSRPILEPAYRTGGPKIMLSA